MRHLICIIRTVHEHDVCYTLQTFYSKTQQQDSFRTFKKKKNCSQMTWSVIISKHPFIFSIYSAVYISALSLYALQIPVWVFFQVSSHSSNITLRLSLRSPQVWLNNACVLNTPWTAHLIKNKRWLTDRWNSLALEVWCTASSATGAMAGLGEPNSNLMRCILLSQQVYSNGWDLFTGRARQEGGGRPAVGEQEGKRWQDRETSRENAEEIANNRN